MKYAFSAQRAASKYTGMLNSSANALTARRFAIDTGWPPPALFVSEIMISGTFARPSHSITWRNFWDGGTSQGPIATRWNVQGWPAVYVLDGRGVIRYKHVRDEMLDQAVAEVMKEANAK